MAEFKLGRIRFVWKGDWSSSTQYYVDDVIRYGGRTYICAVGHTSASDFNTDLTYSPTKWNQMSDGQEWKGDWSTSTFYKINDIVKYGGLLYIANTAHTSSSSTGSGAAGLENATGLEANQSDWTLYAEGLDWKTDWAINTRYKVNDIVKYGGYSYVANVGHTSAATAADGLESQQSYWDTLNAGLEYKGVWAGLTRYKVNDVVKRGSGLWIVKAGQEHTSTTDWETDEAAGYWDQFVEGFEYEDTWNVATPYQQGDIVKYGGNHYIAKTSHTGTTPTTDSQTDWDLYGEDFDFQSDWAHTTSYKIGQVVNHGGYTYRASADSPTTTITVTATDAATNQLTTTDTSAMVADMSIRFSGSSFGDINMGATYYIKTIDSATTFTIATSAGGTVFTPTTATGTLTARFAAQPPHASYWDQLNGGISWQGEWSDDKEYIKGDAVKFGSNAYICIKAHRSEADDGSTIGEQGGGVENSRPDQDVTGTYWNVMTIGSDTDILTTTGDLVYYSGAGPSRLPVGQEGQVLVSDGTYPEWATLGKIDQIYYVAPEGTDLPAPIHGVTLGKPFKTIRYACEQVEKGPRNPDAQYLLERNRVFLQREVSSYLEYQVANADPGSIWEDFDYDEYKCERDVGYIIDRLIWDIGHGGNLKVRAAALSFVNGFSADGEFSDSSEDKVYGGAGLAAEAEQSVAAYTYLQTIIGNVLANEAPTTAYQDSSDSTAVAAQYIDTDYTTEAGVTTTITALMKIVTDTITAGDTSKVPARDVPNVLINVKSGKYEETLPIIVPAETCILGDEIRSTTVVARGSSVDISDSYYTVDSFNHLRGFIDNIVAGTAVTPTSGNTATQDQTWPVADDSETGEITAKLVDVMRVQADYRLGTKHVSYTNDPTGYNSSYLVGYGDARKLLKENKKFLQEEIVQFMVDNYPNLKYGKTDTREDVGHIVDAIVYDLTYGGNAQSIIAARSYWTEKVVSL